VSKRSSGRKALWSGVKLPSWDANALYELYLIHRAGHPNDRQRDAFARQLMILITANFGRKRWIVSLRKAQMDPEVVAADVLTFVYQKCPTVQLETPCVKVLVSVLNRMIFNRVISIWRQESGKQTAVPESQTTEGGEEGFVTQQACSAQVDPGRLARLLKAAEDPVLSPVRGNITDLCVLYRYLCRQLVRQNTILTHAERPKRLRERIDPDVQHAEVSYRLNKLVRDLAAGGECVGWDPDDDAPGR
jgi:hypothetical protein